MKGFNTGDGYMGLVDGKYMMESLCWNLSGIQKIRCWETA